MVGQRTARTSSFQCVARLVLAAMLLRAFVPAGWMPNISGLARGVPIVICSGSGAQTVLVDPDGKPVQPANPTDHGVCAFAASGPLALPLAVLFLALLLFALGTPLILPKSDLIAAGRRLSGGAGPRAPPADLPV